jgi:hypothetical protein
MGRRSSIWRLGPVKNVKEEKNVEQLAGMLSAAHCSHLASTDVGGHRGLAL